MSSVIRTLHLGLNLHGAGGHSAAWRWPGTNPSAFFDIGHYVRAAKIAERGLLDAVFLADTPAVPFDITRQPPLNGLEPTLVLSVIARETTRIGLIATASTTYNEPYNLARRFQSLDVITWRPSRLECGYDIQPSDGSKLWWSPDRTRRALQARRGVR